MTDSHTAEVRFRAVVQPFGKTATGVEVPPAIVEALGAGKRPPVRVTIGPHTYRNTVAPMGGIYLIGISAENRSLAGVSAGDEIDIDLELDTAPRVVEVPADLRAALDGDARARVFFESLSYSRKQGYVQPINQAKSEATRRRRVEAAIVALRAGKLDR
jgi:Bacteriocin-protection, YdeI or OmpD-Associated/Domain of unknown function (DUF1905)